HKDCQVIPIHVIPFQAHYFAQREAPGMRRPSPSFGMGSATPEVMLGTPGPSGHAELSAAGCSASQVQWGCCRSSSIGGPIEKANASHFGYGPWSSVQAARP